MLVNFKPMYEIFIQNQPEQSNNIAVETPQYNTLILETLVVTAQQPKEGYANTLQVAADMVYGTISTANYCTLVN